ncbi:scarecrow-like protein 8 [Lotus japonicus]|uniref:scarecrow-like protein 8 n=1 Tax=Lotus japonicus TaxID=34305 RepID=UPI002589D392|nr:scarecrow-like protein 8 [Lotus japonicus]
MSSPGGGAPNFYGGFPGRSNNNNNFTTTTSTTHNLHPLYRTQQQLPPIFLDPSLSHIAQRQTPSIIGKRTLAEFQIQNHQNQNQNQNQIQNPVLSNLLLRSVKPRNFHHASPIDFSTSSPEFSNSFSSTSSFPSQRLPFYNHLHSNVSQQQSPFPITNSNPTNPNFPYQISNFSQVLNGATTTTTTHGPEKRVMDHRLQELEKQLLEDSDDDEEGDAVSVITNSEWSETIQSLIGAGQNNPTRKPDLSSPTSSTTSTNSTITSMASPAPTCSKQSLMEAASAISEGKLEAASEILSRLGQASNPNGNSDQRFTDCMVSALKSRLNQAENPPPVAELFSREHAESTQLLFEHSVCFKVAFMAANLAILEAAFDDTTTTSMKLCVVDFEIGHGRQYVSLLHELSARLAGKPVTVKVIAVAEDGADERLKTVGDMLGQQAERLRIGFEFKVVSCKLAELTREALGCEPDETLAVNFAFKLFRMPDESVSTENPRDELLRRVKALSPRVVTLVEQELNTNTAPFVPRVTESCSYYSALFDSIESTVARESLERVKIEQGLSRKVGNSVACEGRDRVERCEVFGKWRARMSMAGFRLRPVGQRVAESITARLGAENRVTVKEENGGICCGWVGRTLTVASAWR